MRQSLNEHLLSALLPQTSSAAMQRSSFHDLLQANDFEGLAAQLRAIFAAIPHQWHTRNEIATYEGYYASVVYSCFAAEGFDIVPEDSSNRGRAAT